MKGGILVIDDSEDDCMFYRRVLGERVAVQYSIAEASDGDEGLRSLARELPAAAVVASDRFAAALAVARVNCARHAPRVALVCGDGLGPFGAGVLDLVVSTGLQVFEAMLEQDREALCGPKWKRLPERSATRAGRTSGEVTLGGRRIVLQRPRVRSATAGELRLPSFAFAAERDPLDARTLEFYAVHVEAEDEHGENAMTAVEWFARTEEQQARVRRAFRWSVLAHTAMAEGYDALLDG